MTIMEGELDLHTVPLTSLTYEARHLLSCLLNSSKILLSEGPDKLPRDWRGLASLINITLEIANSFEKDRTAKVLEHWILKRDGTSTIGKLLEYVQRIDRYDIFDDFVDLSSKGKLIINQQPPQVIANNQVALLGCQAVLPARRFVDEDDIEENQITFDDKIHGAPQFYHAYVLYAQEDRDFVDMMLIRMRERNFKLCTEDDILPDHQTTYKAVSRLISSDRCHRIVLIYSPDFLTSPANNFYMDYAQAIGIEMRKPKIVPVMYRYCQLPPSVVFYSKLYYTQVNRPSYDFWDRLSCSLNVTHFTPPPSPPRLKDSSSTSFSAINITELPMSSSQEYTNGISMGQTLLALPSPVSSRSMSDISNLSGTYDSGSVSGVIQDGEGKTSKSKRFKNIFSFKLKKKKDVA